MVGLSSPTSRRRALRVGLVAIALATTLIGAVAVWQLGWPATSAGIATALDRAHVYGPRSKVWRATLRLRFASPVRDARSSFKAGDRRLLGLASIGLDLPGVQALETHSYSKRFGVRLLASGCVVESNEEEGFRRAAADYAARYNTEIVALGRP